MNHALDIWMGWSRGYSFANYQQLEQFYKERAKSYIFASLSVYSQISIISGLAIQIFFSSPHVKNKNQIFGYYKIISYASIPFAFLTTKIFNGSDRGSFKDKVVRFFNDYISALNKVLMIAAAITCLVIGDYFTGGSILAALAYSDLNHMGYVPQRISLLVRSCMPILSTLAFALRGQYLEKAIASIHLFFEVFPALMQKIVAEKELQNENTPVEVISNMPFDKIEAILNAPEEHFQVNTVHASKEFILDDLEEERNLGDFLEIFEKTSWLGYNQEFINTLRDNLRHNIELIPKYPHEVRDNSRRILAHLKKRSPQNNYKEIESIFQSLGGTKEAFLSSRLRWNTWEIIDQIANQSNLPYSQRVNRKLQMLRRSLLKEGYIMFATEFLALIKFGKPINFDQDVHSSMFDEMFADMFSKCNFGFYPVKEVRNFSAYDWLQWKIFSLYRQELSEIYISKLDSVFKADEFNSYFDDWLRQQTQLEAGQRQLLSTRYALQDDKKGFYRLMLVELGALKYLPSAVA